MKTILFIDDWMLDWRRNVVRRFGRPEIVQKQLTFDEPGPLARPAKSYQNVILDPDSGRYGMWYEVAGSRPLPGNNFTGTLCYAESDDGFTWTYPDLGNAAAMGVDASLRNCVGYDVPPIGTRRVTFDPFDPDPSRRYKLLGQVERPGHPKYAVFVSPDGLAWTHVPNSSWFPDEPSRMGTDCDNNMLFNPVSGKYQVICRRACLDRRIAITESDDLVHWTEPRVILYPDPLDEPLIQFYSMGQFWYADHFLGLMQRQHVASTEMGAVKWLGKVDTELVYSFNGVHWNRTDRRPFIGRTEPGSPGCEEIFTSSMVEEPDGTLRFYGLGADGEHYATKPPEPVSHNTKILVHRLRPCGFAYLEPVAGYGYIGTRNLIPRDGRLRVNFQAPNGCIRVQASHPETGEKAASAHPGFGFEDCVPLTGDQACGEVQWKNGKNLDELVGKWVRLEFQLFQARLYAIHWDFRIQYGDPILERV